MHLSSRNFRKLHASMKRRPQNHGHAVSCIGTYCVPSGFWAQLSLLTEISVNVFDLWPYGLSHFLSPLLFLLIFMPFSQVYREFSCYQDSLTSCQAQWSCLIPLFWQPYSHFHFTFLASIIWRMFISLPPSKIPSRNTDKVSLSLDSQTYYLLSPSILCQSRVYPQGIRAGSDTFNHSKWLACSSIFSLSHSSENSYLFCRQKNPILKLKKCSSSNIFMSFCLIHRLGFSKLKY